MSNNFKWAATHTFNYSDSKANKFEEYQEALDYANENLPNHNSIYIWKLTKGKPLKWDEIA